LAAAAKRLPDGTEIEHEMTPHRETNEVSLGQWSPEAEAPAASGGQGQCPRSSRGRRYSKPSFASCPRDEDRGEVAGQASRSTARSSTLGSLGRVRLLTVLAGSRANV